jgi:hypothetical protein
MSGILGVGRYTPRMPSRHAPVTKYIIVDRATTPRRYWTGRNWTPDARHATRYPFMTSAILEIESSRLDSVTNNIAVEPVLIGFPKGRLSDV